MENHDFRSPSKNKTRGIIYLPQKDLSKKYEGATHMYDSCAISFTSSTCHMCVSSHSFNFSIDVTQCTLYMIDMP